MTFHSLLLAFQELDPVEPQTPAILAGTMTATATREERDQDPQFLAGTNTFTEAREERDQDPQILAGTATGTRAREESDQDPHIPCLFTFPRA